MISSASHEEFRFNFSTVSAAPPGVSDDRCKFAVSERHGRTYSFVCIHNKNKIIVFEKYCMVRIISQYIFGTWHGKALAKNTTQSENDPAYMIFLAYVYECYIKTSILLKPLILIL